MPIYEYKCLACGKLFEKVQKVSDAPLETCESCGGKVEKQISRAGFQFKGSGWYVTDYASSSAKSESSKSGSSDSTSSAETASKPAEPSGGKE